VHTGRGLRDLPRRLQPTAVTTPTARRLTLCVAEVLAEHAKQ
jgi:hypothetical protein